MRREIQIWLQCPMCDTEYSMRVKLIENLKNNICTHCHNEGVFMEPNEIILIHTTSFEEWKEGDNVTYETYRPLYYNEVDKQCIENCNKCDGCEHLDDDGDCELLICDRPNDCCDFNLHYLKELEKNGFTSQELFNLDDTMATFIYPRLKAWLDNGITGNPSGITYDEWIIILNKILHAMKMIKDGDKYYQLNSDGIDKVQEGCELLGKWFTHLWD